LPVAGKTKEKSQISIEKSFFICQRFLKNNYLMVTCLSFLAMLANNFPTKKSIYTVQRFLAKKGVLEIPRKKCL
jgi:hypothetical protein